MQPDEKTLADLRNLGKIQATTRECACFFDVAEPTFIDFLKRYKNAREAFDFGKGKGLVSLRRLQMEAASNGNATMLVWLGKQLLNQKDRLEHGGQVTFTHEQALLALDDVANEDDEDHVVTH